MKEARGRLADRVNGEDIKVAASHLRCPKCGEVVLRLEDARRLRADAIAAYRKKVQLLSADEIRAVRERHGLTQAELAKGSAAIAGLTRSASPCRRTCVARRSCRPERSGGGDGTPVRIGERGLSERERVAFASSSLAVSSHARAAFRSPRFDSATLIQQALWARFPASAFDA
jgi:hypothetical protein